MSAQWKKTDAELFHRQLQQHVSEINQSDYIVLAGDFNVRVSNQEKECTIGRFGEAVLIFNKLTITNAFFNKRLVNKYTWEARGLHSLIDYVIVNEKCKGLVRDTHVDRGSEVGSDHYLVISKLTMKKRWKKKPSPK